MSRCGRCLFCITFSFIDFSQRRKVLKCDVAFSELLHDERIVGGIRKICALGFIVTRTLNKRILRLFLEKYTGHLTRITTFLTFC